MNGSRRVVHDDGVPFIVRVLWFVLVGWYVTVPWVLIAWLLNVTIIGLPLGLWMLNRVPLVMTLRMPASVTVAQAQGGRVAVQRVGVDQPNLLVRVFYFVLIGWWFSLLWSGLGWLLCVSIIGLPVGVWMLNRVPEVTTLMRQ